MLIIIMLKMVSSGIVDEREEGSWP